MQSTLELFPFAKQTNDNIEQQNKFLRKISLTGKINALDFSANLFTYTDETIIKFDSLKRELIDALVEENIHKVQEELRLKAQLSIDVLKRNLFERTADVGFLATDDEIITFLEDPNFPKEKIEDRLRAYISKYSVYENILIFDNMGTLKAAISPTPLIKKIQERVIQTALQQDSFVESYIKEDKALLYAHKVQSSHQDIGVLVLIFKFEDELKRIFSSIATSDDLLYLSDPTGVIASNHPSIKVNSAIYFQKRNGLELYKNRAIAITTKTKGYQGYHGLEWYMTAIDTPKKSTPNSHFPKQVLPPKLKNIIDNAHEIVDDLGDVIINGELIASKHRQYTLSPILENLRNISTSLVEDINNSAENLADMKTSSLIASTKLSTLFSIDLMDRNLYERANDCRWWALTSRCIEELSAQKPDSQKLHNILSHINTLYTVYSEILIYDKQAQVIACSDNQDFIGTTITDEAVSRCLQNRNPQAYFVSPFAPSTYYHDKPTYLYHASILGESDTLGGIALVFDSEPEFNAILKDSMPEGADGFFLFCDKDKQVISSTNEAIKPLDTLCDLPLPNFSKNEIVQKFVTYHDKEYIVTVAPSKGYREYKNEDNYKNELYAISFIAL